MILIICNLQHRCSRGLGDDATALKNFKKVILCDKICKLIIVKWTKTMKQPNIEKSAKNPDFKTSSQSNLFA
jgi:hypothetical protein